MMQIVTVGRPEPGWRFQRPCTLRLIISGTATTKVVRQVLSGSAIPRRHGGRSIGPHPRPGARCGRSGTGCTWSSLACQQGCTEASHDLSIITSFKCAALTPASAAAKRDALGLAPVPSTSMLALGDNMVSNVEAAAQSTTEQCSWSAPMGGSSHSCWLSSVLHQHDLSRCGWTWSYRR